MTRLVLFDIDGTILSSNGAAASAFRNALEEVFGTSGPKRGYSFAGRTDPQIAHDLLAMAGLDEATIQEGLPRAWDLYLEGLAFELETVAATVYPGVVEILDRLDTEADAIVGLLTGNIVGGARLKLEAADIDFDRFKVGAYGSDHRERSALPAIAVDRAEASFGRRFEGKSVVIIGDTPADVACGEHLGVRTIAVATGTYTAGQLEPCGPDHLFDDLADTDAVWRAIFD